MASKTVRLAAGRYAVSGAKMNMRKPRSLTDRAAFSKFVARSALRVIVTTRQFLAPMRACCWPVRQYREVTAELRYEARNIHRAAVGFEESVNCLAGVQAQRE